MQKTWLGLLCLVLGLLCGQAWGQYQPDSTITLPTVSIHAPATPLGQTALVQTQIDSGTMAQQAAYNLADVLSAHTPVFIKTYGNGALATAAFRGTAASHTQVRRNGIRINNPMLGQTDFSLLPVFFSDGVTLLHGGSSLHNGSGALGGSVNITTGPLRQPNNYAHITTAWGSFGAQQFMARAGSGGPKLKADVRLLYRKAQNNFTFTNTANGLNNTQTQQNASYYQHGATTDLLWRPATKHRLRLNAMYLRSHRNLPPIMSYAGSGRREYQQDNLLHLTAHYMYATAKTTIEYTTGYAGHGIGYYLGHQTPLGTLENHNTASLGNGWHNIVTAQHQHNTNNLLRLRINYNYYRAQITNQSTGNGYIATRPETGIALSYHRQLPHGLRAFALLRQDAINNTPTPLMASAGAQWQPTQYKPITLKATITRNYHPPTLNDLYWQPGGNPNLQPEQGYTVDATLLFKKNINKNWRTTAQLATYRSIINNWIIWLPSDFTYWTPQNLKTVHTQGTELTTSLAYQYQKWKITARGQYAFTQTQNQNPNSPSHGKQLIYIPQHKANALLHLGYGNLQLHYAYNYTGLRHTTATNEPTGQLPAFGLHNATLAYNFTLKKTKTACRLVVNNIANTNYQAILWRAMPGRNYLFTFSLQI